MKFLRHTIQKLRTTPAEKYLEYGTDLALDLALILLDFLSSPILVPIRIAKGVVLKLSKGVLVRGIRSHAHRFSKKAKPEAKEEFSLSETGISATKETGE